MAGAWQIQQPDFLGALALAEQINQRKRQQSLQELMMQQQRTDRMAKQAEQEKIDAAYRTYGEKGDLGQLMQVAPREAIALRDRPAPDGEKPGQISPQMVARLGQMAGIISNKPEAAPFIQRQAKALGIPESFVVELTPEGAPLVAQWATEQAKAESSKPSKFEGFLADASGILGKPVDDPEVRQYAAKLYREASSRGGININLGGQQAPTRFATETARKVSSIRDIEDTFKELSQIGDPDDFLGFKKSIEGVVGELTGSEDAVKRQQYIQKLSELMRMVAKNSRPEESQGYADLAKEFSKTPTPAAAKAFLANIPNIIDDLQRYQGEVTDYSTNVLGQENDKQKKPTGKPNPRNPLQGTIVDYSIKDILGDAQPDDEK